jgi:nitrite reductase (NADH) large subunit
MLVVEGHYPLSGWLDEESGAALTNLLKEAGIRVLCQNQVAEVLGDQEVKAVRLSSGKVFAAEILVVDRFEPDLRLFKESGICNETSFLVNAEGRTSLPYVFALGRAAAGPDMSWPWNSDVTAACFTAQAERIAAVISGRIVSVEVPLKQVTLNLPGHPVFIAGEVIEEIRGAVHGTDQLLKKYFVKDGRVAGAVAIGFPEDRDFLLEMVKIRADVSQIPEPSAETTRL